MEHWDESKLQALAREHGTPLFVYDRAYLQKRAESLLELDMPNGLVTRFAVKANNHPEIIKLFDGLGLQFDASSSYEADELLALDIPGDRISLSSQQPAQNLESLLGQGVRYVATSLHQLELFLQTPGRPDTVGLRVNPGIGDGHNNRLTTGGVNSSFGLWAAYVPEALALVNQHSVRIDRLHVHIGSGADPSKWGDTIETALALVEQMPDVVALDMGGGYKIHRFADEPEADMQDIARVFREHLAAFTERTRRTLQLEIEPGTWLVGHAGVLLASVVDIVDTGEAGHTFLRLDTGMNDIARPGMYGSQHEIAVLGASSETHDYIVSGHNCESGDILTPAPNDPEGLAPRTLRRAEIGDVVAIYDTGAYCRSMSHKGYNSYPSASEILID